MKILEAPLTGWLRWEQLDAPYRAVLRYRDATEQWRPGAPVIVVQQKIGDTWGPTPGQWLLETLTEGKEPSDRIYLDGGQGWNVTGMRAVIEEALNITGGVR